MKIIYKTFQIKIHKNTRNYYLSRNFVLQISPVIDNSASKIRDSIETYMPDITYIANISARQNGYTLDENQLTSDVAEMVHFELLLTEVIIFFTWRSYINNFIVWNKYKKYKV